MSQTKTQLVEGLNINTSAPATALQIDASGNINLDSNTLYVDATNNRVGLGTSSPSSLLEIDRVFKVKTVNTTTIADERGLTVYNNQSNGLLDTTLVYGGASTSYLAIGHHNGSSYSERLRIDSSGRVGIGTTSPGTYGAFAVRTATATNQGSTSGHFSDGATGSLYINHASNVVTLLTDTNNLAFAPGASEKARIDNSGRLLVGTSTARTNFYNTTGYDCRLQLEGTDGTTTAHSIVRNSNDNGGSRTIYAKSRGTSIGSNTVVQSGDQIGAVSFQGSDGTEFVEAAVIECFVDATPGANDMPGRLVFSTTADGASSPTERMRITNGGVVCVNTTSSGGYGEKFRVYTGSGSESTAHFYHGSVSDRDNLIVQHDRAQGGTSATQIRFRDGYATSVGSITSTGSSTAYNTSSDYRLKENIVPLTNAVDRVNQLKAHRFNFIVNPDQTVDGFLAHEAQTVVPECVVGKKDEVDDEGNPVYQGIDQSKLVPLLTAALQETIAELQALKAEVAALKGA